MLKYYKGIQISLSPRAGALLFALAMILCVLLRLHRIDTIGQNSNVDGVYATNIAKAWSEGTSVYRVAEGSYLYRPVAFLVFAGGIKLFGFNDYAIKLVNVFADIANIGLVFVAAYLLAGRNTWPAYLSATIYGLLPRAIRWSRGAMVHTLSCLMVLTAFLFFVLYRRSTSRLGRYACLLASAIFSGFAALTHEELILIAPGYALLIVAHQFRWSWLWLRNALLEVALFSLGTVLASWGMINAVLSGSVTRLPRLGLEDLGSSPPDAASFFLRRVLSSAWAGVVENSSNLFAALVVVLLLLSLVGVLLGFWRRSSAPPFPSLPHLCLGPVGAYLVGFCLFFTFRQDFARLFFPLVPLLIIWASIGCHGYLRYLPRRALGQISWIAVSLLVFVSTSLPVSSRGSSPNQVDKERPSLSGSTKGSERERKRSSSRNQRDKARPSLSGSTKGSERKRKQVQGSKKPSPLSKFKRLYRKLYGANASRAVFNELGDKVNAGNRLLVTPHIVSASAGQRVFQLEYYFGDNARYLIDHEQRLEDLFREQRIRYVLFTMHGLDRRLVDGKKYQRYEYDGKWGKKQKWVRSANYGFGPGDYSVEREYEVWRRLHESGRIRAVSWDGDLMTRNSVTSDYQLRPSPTSGYVIFELVDGPT